MWCVIHSLCYCYNDEVLIYMCIDAVECMVVNGDINSGKKHSCVHMYVCMCIYAMVSLLDACWISVLPYALKLKHLHSTISVPV